MVDLGSQLAIATSEKDVAYNASQNHVQDTRQLRSENEVLNELLIAAEAALATYRAQIDSQFEELGLIGVVKQDFEPEESNRQAIFLYKNDEVTQIKFSIYDDKDADGRSRLW